MLRPVVQREIRESASEIKFVVDHRHRLTRFVSGRASCLRRTPGRSGPSADEYTTTSHLLRHARSCGLQPARIVSARQVPRAPIRRRASRVPGTEAEDQRSVEQATLQRADRGAPAAPDGCAGQRLARSLVSEAARETGVDGCLSGQVSAYGAHRHDRLWTDSPDNRRRPERLPCDATRLRTGRTNENDLGRHDCRNEIQRWNAGAIQALRRGIRSRAMPGIEVQARSRTNQGRGASCLSSFARRSRRLRWATRSTSFFA